MTLIVGCRYRNKYILAADGRVTNDTGIIESNTCQKIEAYENYVMAGAGTCNTPASHVATFHHRGPVRLCGSDHSRGDAL